jgi:hypothetical protein
MGRVISARGELRLMSCAARSTSASVIHIWRRLRERPRNTLGGVVHGAAPKKESEHVGFPRPSLSYALLGPAVKGPMDKRSPKSGGSGRHKGSFGGSLTHEVI